MHIRRRALGPVRGGCVNNRVIFLGSKEENMKPMLTGGDGRVKRLLTNFHLGRGPGTAVPCVSNGFGAGDAFAHASSNGRDDLGSDHLITV